MISTPDNPRQDWKPQSTVFRRSFDGGFSLTRFSTAGENAGPIFVGKSTPVHPLNSARRGSRGLLHEAGPEADRDSSSGRARVAPSGVPDPARIIKNRDAAVRDIG
jgi:hypothetical protein